MLGWIIIIVISIFLIRLIKKNLTLKPYDREPFLAFGILGLVIITITICMAYQNHIINAPYEYKRLKNMLKDTKGIIDTNQHLNLKDMEMGKILHSDIRNLRDFEQEIESCRHSPFSIFKPILVID